MCFISMFVLPLAACYHLEMEPVALCVLGLCVIIVLCGARGAYLIHRLEEMDADA